MYILDLASTFLFTKQVLCKIVLNLAEHVEVLFHVSFMLGIVMIFAKMICTLVKVPLSVCPRLFISISDSNLKFGRTKVLSLGTDRTFSQRNCYRI